MNAGEEEFLRQLRATFAVEAQEHLHTISAGLLELEQAASPEVQRGIVETVFRAAHSLKGAARAVDLGAIESHCQSLEEVLASWKRGDAVPARDTLDRLHRVLDAVSTALAAPDAPPARHQSLGAPGAPVRAGFAAARARPAAAPAPAPARTQGKAASPGNETVRVGVAKLEAQLLQAQEMLAAKLAAGQRVADVAELAGRVEAWRKAWTDVEPEARWLRQCAGRDAAAGAPGTDAGLTRLLDFFDWSSDYLKSVEDRAASLGRMAEQDRHSLGKLVDDSLEHAKKLLLLPFATISAALPKVVRDLCRDQGKEADFLVRGDDVEIDKRILEEMKDPLIHLLRNSVDHGIELPAERGRRGKPDRATIALDVTRLGTAKVQVLVSDDGAGIDTAKVRASAVGLGRIAPEQAARLGENEAAALAFEPEVSTSPMITQVSGRGLGLAIVREKAEALGGEVAVESHPGRGTLFRIVLPVTRAAFRGILVKAAGQVFVVPTTQVERIVRGRAQDVRTVEGRETIALDGRAVALAGLAQVLELPAAGGSGSLADGVPLLILGTGEQRVAFAVDEILDEQEVLVKPLAQPLARVRNIAAATVLGSGQLAPILNVADLLKSARRPAGSPARATEPAQPVRQKAILVAEDSITSRMLIKGILESAGYRVKTAVDGMEAFSALRSEPFDLLVSDVEMPRLNGFELTARIRADRKLTELPVVLVTALETRQDRERGIDAGANAYLVKSSFDQSNLLEAVGRLI